MDVVDLFAGIGGFSLGFKWAGFNILDQVEIDPFCQKVLRKNFPEANIFSDVKDYSRDLRGKILVGGFPCQDISTADPVDRKGLDGKKSGLWKEFSRVIKQGKPRAICIENVAGIRSLGLATVLKNLWAFGYGSQWHILSAKGVGAIHRRERCFIIAHSNSQGFLRHKEVEKALHFSKEKGQSQYFDQALSFQDRYKRGDTSRINDGVPSRLDRYRNTRKVVSSLGNSIVPQSSYSVAMILKSMLDE